MPTRMNPTRPPTRVQGLRYSAWNVQAGISQAQGNNLFTGAGRVHCWCAARLVGTQVARTGDEMTALQDEVASGTASLHDGRVLRASKHADFVVQETVLKESQSGFSVAHPGLLRECHLCHSLRPASGLGERLGCQQRRSDSSRSLSALSNEEEPLAYGAPTSSIC